MNVVPAVAPLRSEFVVGKYTWGAPDASSLAQGYDVSEELVRDGLRHNNCAARYDEGAFRLLDSVKPRRASLMWGEVWGPSDAGPRRAVLGLRHFRVFR